jgi:hypothetical protein
MMILLIILDFVISILLKYNIFEEEIEGKTFTQSLSWNALNAYKQLKKLYVNYGYAQIKPKIFYIKTLWFFVASWKKKWWILPMHKYLSMPLSCCKLLLCSWLNFIFLVI